MAKLDSNVAGVLGTVMGLAGQYLVFALDLNEKHPVVAAFLFILSTSLVIFGVVYWWRQTNETAHRPTGRDETSTFLGTTVGESTAYVESTAQHVAKDSAFGKLGGHIRHQPPKD